MFPGLESLRRILAARMPDRALRYGLPVASLAALVLVAYTCRFIFAIRVSLVYGLLTVALFLVILGSAWLGYGPGVLTCALATVVVPRLLRTGPSRGAWPDLVRLGLVLIISLLVSRLSETRRRREAELRHAAEEAERRVQQRTEEALRAAAVAREAEDRLRFVLDAAEIGYWDHDVAANLTTRSRKHDEIFGHRESVSHWDYRTFLRHVHPEDRQMVDAGFQRALATGQEALEFRIVWPDYSVHWVWTQVRSYRDAAGSPLHVSGVLLDITGRRQAADRLREQAQLLDLAHDAICSLDPNSTIAFWNQGAERMYGWHREEALGKNAHELLQTVFPEPLADIERKLLEQGHWEGELCHTRRDGARLRVASRWALLREPDGRPRGYLEIATDMTECRRIEEQLREAQKLESLGVLAGGVAHDFNNLLTGILGNASLARDGLAGHHAERLLLEEIMKSAERAADLTRQLLAYAGKGRFVMRTVNLSALVREIGGLLQASVPKHVRLQFELADGLAGVHADPGQLQQVVTHLVINGAEAARPEGGTVLVRTGLQQVDEPYIATMSSAGDLLQPGEYVSLEVHDTGCGMDEDILAKIFDPFFTTKFAGRGLGLSAVLGIVRGHRGAVKVSSQPGEGTTFKVLLPASLHPIEPQAPSSATVRALA